MLPLKLTLSGIYSYREPQEIDFSRLMEGQLFGIFGPVGSGKSTILEAISFALFNKTERLGGHDRLNYNMMNLQSNSLLVDFEFLNPADKTEYRFRVEGTRDKKNFEKVEAYTRRAFKKKEGEWEPMEKTTAEDIIGLSYDNFRRTVIIPQGKFQEFLMLTGAERSRMLQELFYLDRFDLSNKVSSLDKKNDLEKSNVEGQLQQLGDVSAEQTKEREGQLAKLSILIKESLEKLGFQKKELETLKEQKALFEKEAQSLALLAALENALPHWAQRKASLERFERCQRKLAQPIAQLNTANTAMAQSAQRVAALEHKLAEQKQKLAEQEPIHAHWKAEYEGREAWRKEAEGLFKILENKKLQALLATDELTLGEKTGLLENLELAHAALREKAQLLRENLAALKQGQPDLAQLHHIQNWFAEQGRLEKDCEAQSALVEKLQLEYQALLGAVKDKTPKGTKDVSAIKESLQLAAILEDVRDLISDKERLLARTDEDIRTMAAQQKLKDFSDELRENAPCPLCGSTHHPLPLRMEHVGERLKALDAEKKAFSGELKTLSESLKALEVLESHIKNKETDGHAARLELERRIQVAAAHRASFAFEGFDRNEPQQVAEALKAAEAIAQQVADTDKGLQETERKALLHQQSLDRGRVEVGALREKVAAQRAEINVRASAVPASLMDTHGAHGEAELAAMAAALRARADQAESKFPAAETALQDTRQTLAALEGEHGSERNMMERNRAALLAAEEGLAPLLSEEQFASIAEAEVFLTSFPEGEKEKKEIAKFEQDLEVARRNVAELRAKTAGQVFDEGRYKAAEMELQNTDSQIIEYRKLETQEYTLLEQERLQLAKKEALETVHARLKARADGLKVLKSMFKGNGFVNFVSRIYLDQLCQVANERFQKLTRNQLRLELDGENNTFQVRDFLNEGRSRSIKTLSGGQMFQASLSLALALAEHIQQVRRSDRHFFFLDEGFGSLDKDSLQVVFDTLKSLRREGRYVGIISHVEDLQQEIEACLTIKNTEERGSEVAISGV